MFSTKDHTFSKLKYQYKFSDDCDTVIKLGVNETQCDVEITSHRIIEARRLHSGFSEIINRESE